MPHPRYLQSYQARFATPLIDYEPELLFLSSNTSFLIRVTPMSTTRISLWLSGGKVEHAASLHREHGASVGVGAWPMD